MLKNRYTINKHKSSFVQRQQNLKIQKSKETCKNQINANAESKCVEGLTEK